MHLKTEEAIIQGCDGDKGAYLLHIELAKPRELQIGRLGKRRFKRGHYVYTGSALNGLSARIARHRRRTKKTHWHVDYLLRDAILRSYRKVPSGERQECLLNSAVAEHAQATMQVPGFGASDCSCDSHLTHFERPPALRQFRAEPPADGVEKTA